MTYPILEGRPATVGSCQKYDGTIDGVNLVLLLLSRKLFVFLFQQSRVHVLFQYAAACQAAAYGRVQLRTSAACCIRFHGLVQSERKPVISLLWLLVKNVSLRGVLNLRAGFSGPLLPCIGSKSVKLSWGVPHRSRPRSARWRRRMLVLTVDVAIRLVTTIGVHGYVVCTECKMAVGVARGISQHNIHRNTMKSTRRTVKVKDSRVVW